MSTKFSLRIIGPNNSRRFELVPGDISHVGRAVESNILIADPNISREQFVVHAQEHYVHVEMNPQSPNRLIKNGQTVVSVDWYPGEYFDIGPYRFELEATDELPVAAPTGLPPDPAGCVDVNLALEVNRIAPRWSTVGRADDGGVDQRKKSTESSSAKKVLLAVSLMIVSVVIGLEFSSNDSSGGDLLDTTKVKPPEDVMELVKPPSCQGSDACLNVAKESYQVAEKLRASEARDLPTLYKIAKSYRRSVLALQGQTDKLPKLQEQEQRSRHLLQTALDDQLFKMERARAEGDAMRQLSAVQTLLALCAEDPLRSCTDWERTGRQLQERLSTR